MAVKVIDKIISLSFIFRLIDWTLCFWDASKKIEKESAPQLVLQGHVNSVISVAISRCGGIFATGSGDFKCKLWRISQV